MYSVNHRVIYKIHNAVFINHIVVYKNHIAVFSSYSIDFQSVFGFQKLVIQQ